MDNQDTQNSPSQVLPQQTPPVSPVVQTPVSQPVSNVEKPKPKFPIAIIIGIILLLLIAGSAAGFYVYKQQTSKIVVKPTQTPIVQKQAPTPTPDPTANWKTYTFDDIGFSIKLPTTWFSHSSAKAFTRTEVIFSYPIDFNSLDSLLPNQSGIEISSEPLNGKTLSDKSNEIKTSTKNYSTPASLKLDNNDALLFRQNNTPNWRIIITAKNDKYYFLDFANINEVLFNQILSTFKFTDSSSFKTYNNGKFSFSYPSNMFVYEYKDANNAVAISDIQNPSDIPLKISPENHTIIQVSLINGIMPSCFPYTNGGTGCVNSTIKPYTSSNGYVGIRGQSTSTMGLGETTLLKESSNSWAGISYEIGDKNVLNHILSTFKFTDGNTTPTPTCIPRPACLNATPRCMIAEPIQGWCP